MYKAYPHFKKCIYFRAAFRHLYETWMQNLKYSPPSRKRLDLWPPPPNYSCIPCYKKHWKKIPTIIWGSRNQVPRSFLFQFGILSHENNTGIFHLLSGKKCKPVLVTNWPSSHKRSSKDSQLLFRLFWSAYKVKCSICGGPKLPDSQVSRPVLNWASLNLPASNQGQTKASQLSMPTQIKPNTVK